MKRPPQPRPVILLALILAAGCDTTAQTLGPPPTPVPLVATVFNSTGAGGVICHGPTGQTACRQADPASVPPSAGAEGDTMRANTGGTIAAQTPALRFRLVSGAQVQLLTREQLGVGERFLVSAGQALFDHPNGAGEVVVQAGAIRIQPLDTAFSVSMAADGGTMVAVITGTQGIVITGTTALRMTAHHQVDVDAQGHLAAPGPLDAATQALWRRYGLGGP